MSPKFGQCHLPPASEVGVACPCNVKVLAAFFLKLQGFIGISEILMRSPCIFKSLVGISKILMSGYSAMYPRCLNFIASEKLVLTQLHYKGQCLCDFSADEVLTRCHGKDEYWHDFSANKVLTWLHGKDECWRGLTVNEVLT